MLSEILLILISTLWFDQVKGQSDLYENCGIILNSPRVSLSTSPITWPWLVSLGYYTGQTWEHQCGGSLIDSEHILTAAHCIEVLNLSANKKWIFRLGIYNLDERSDTKRELLKTTVHPKYQSGVAYFDVAIVQIEKVVFSPSISPICLPNGPSKNLNKYQGLSATLAGWGIFNSSLVGSQNLITGHFTILNYRRCNITHLNDRTFAERTRAYLPNLFQLSVLCANNPATRQSSCSGDSGGPLFIIDHNSERNSYMQVGIVSGSVAGSNECGKSDIPGVFARIDHPEIFDFIKGNTEGLKTTTLSRSTDWFPFDDEIMDGINLLSQVNFECPDGALVNSLKVEEQFGEFRYNFNCLQRAVKPFDLVSNDVSNPWSTLHEDNTQSLQFLVMQKVDCSEHGALRSLRLESIYAEQKFRYAYNCAMPSDQSVECLECLSKSSQGISTFAKFSDLKTLMIDCGTSDQVLSKFQLIRNGNIHYDYTCCKFKECELGEILK